MTPQDTLTPQHQSGRSRAVAVWLIVVAAWVFAMVVVGGATRLTGSGLSITEWKPLTGALPPLTDKAWNEYFHAYQATPQYQLVNRGMSLAQFRYIFAWEWSHRLLGRLVGVVFAVPAVFFLMTRRMPRRLIWRCGLLFILGGVQGTVGWWMVKSGLEGRVSVAPERLAVHLGLALVLLSSLVWTALESWNGPSREARKGIFPIACTLFAVVVFLQCLLGALVAGNHGGLVYGDWPLMGGSIVPQDYWRGGFWATWVHGPSASQFDHRLGAYGLLIGGLALTLGATRARFAKPALTVWSGLLTVMLLAQAGIGIATLRYGVILPLALLHQALASLLMAGAAALAWRSRRV